MKRKKSQSPAKPKTPMQQIYDFRDKKDRIDRMCKLIGNCPRAWSALCAVTDATSKCGVDSPEAKAAIDNFNELVRRSHQLEEPARPVTHALLPQDPRDRDASDARKQIHLDLLTSGMYAKIMEMAGGHACSVQYGTRDEFLASSLLYAQDVLRRMQPRDDMEAMLISQALWTHARIAHLNNFLLEERNIDLVKSLNESIDRAQNAYRRQMTALAEYRRPQKAAGVYNRIQQANIANQQIVSNGARKRAKPRNARKEKPTNELGSPHEPTTVQTETKLSPKRRGPSLA